MSQLDHHVLDIDYQSEADRICARLREITARQLHRRGLVVAISGGIDSSVCAALAVRALGADRVFTLILPERDSSTDSAARAGVLARHLGVRAETTDIAPTLEAIGCYRARDEAVRSVLPDYGPGWTFKIVIDGGTEGRVNSFRLIARDPDGVLHDRQLGIREQQAIVAATNFKQRIRKTLEYFHADRLNYAVVGTPNRVEYDQGFFVKNGDGAADIKPIAHLYKTQVYGMARHLGLPERICSAVPTTDTYSLVQGQDEFYYGLAYDKMDIALWAINHDVPVNDLALALEVGPEAAEAVYEDIRTKRRTTRYLHGAPVLVSPVPEPGGAS